MLTDNIVYVAAGLVAWRVWDWLDGLVRGKVSEWRRWRKRTRTKQHDKPAASYRIAREPNFPGFTEVNINGTRRIVPDEPSAIRYHIHFHCDGELTFATLRDSVRRLREQNVKPDQSGYYNALVPEDAVYALTCSPAWIYVARYFDRMITAPNEIGRMYGVRFFSDRKTEQTDGRYLEGKE